MFLAEDPSGSNISETTTLEVLNPVYSFFNFFISKLVLFCYASCFSIKK